MAGQYSAHDIWRFGTVQTLAVNSSGGPAMSTANFGSQTYAIRLTTPAALSSTAGVRVKIGVAPVASSTADVLLPPNWIEYVSIRPGEQLSTIGNDGNNYTLSITELTN